MSKLPPQVDLKPPSYESLLGLEQWQSLHPAIRKRFEHTNVKKSVNYTGVMHEIYLSFWGKILAQLCRLIGTPLALHGGKNIPMTVKVYEDAHLHGMTWDRFYQYPNRPENRVRSTKCIRPELGLVELVGFGFGMHLQLSTVNNALHFESIQFFLEVSGKRISIPHWLSPGKTTVIQRALDDEKFEFSLDVVHPFLGRMYWQIGTFQASLN